MGKKFLTASRCADQIGWLGPQLVRSHMLPRFHLALAIVFALAFLCGCKNAQIQPLTTDKVVLNVSFAEEVRLLTRLGFTNMVSYGRVERDSLGTRLFITVEPGPSHGKTQEERTQKLVIVTVQGTQVVPWHFPANERITDDAKVAVWQDPKREYTWQVRNGEWLPKGCYVEDVSGDWMVVIAPGRAPWVADLDKPAAVAAELPKSSGLIAIYTHGQMVHVFTRRGWRNEEGPMTYFLYDFSRGASIPTKQMVLPSWARITLDMDPDSGLVIINDNNSFWGRTWLYNINTGKRKLIQSSYGTVIVKRDVAQKWMELTKP